MHYIVRNELGNEIAIYPWGKGFMFVDKKFGYRNRKPRLLGLSITKFDRISEDVAIRSCVDQMNAYGNTYPDVFVVDKNGETIWEDKQ